MKAQQGAAWAFVAGIAVSVCDALVFVKVADGMSVAFHAFALFYLGNACIDLRAAKKAAGLRWAAVRDGAGPQRCRHTSRRWATAGSSSRHLPSPRPVKPPVG